MKFKTLILVLIIVTSCKNVKQANTDEVEINTFFKKLTEAKLSSGKLMRMDSFPSKYIKPRPVDVWLPEHNSKEKKYAVLYMHDGQMLFDSTTTWNKQEWKVD